jgi:hypothetical protein
MPAKPDLLRQLLELAEKWNNEASSEASNANIFRNHHDMLNFRTSAVLAAAFATHSQELLDVIKKHQPHQPDIPSCDSLGMGFPKDT